MSKLCWNQFCLLVPSLLPIQETVLKSILPEGCSSCNNWYIGQTIPGTDTGLLRVSSAARNKRRRSPTRFTAARPELPRARCDGAGPRFSRRQGGGRRTQPAARLATAATEVATRSSCHGGGSRAEAMARRSSTRLLAAAEARNILPRAQIPDSARDQHPTSRWEDDSYNAASSGDPASEHGLSSSPREATEQPSPSQKRVFSQKWWRRDGGRDGVVHALRSITMQDSITAQDN